MDAALIEQAKWAVLEEAARNLSWGNKTIFSANEFYEQSALLLTAANAIYGGMTE